MELVYLWIEEYLNIKNCGFNFGNRVVVKESVNIAERKIKLEVNNNTSYIPGFFGRRVKNITGIVGGNGVGKSNLLDFLKGFMHDNSSNYKWLSIFFNPKTNSLHTFMSLYDINHSARGQKRSTFNNWDVSFSNFTGYSFEKISDAAGQHDFLGTAYEDSSDTENQSPLIFYSPFLDFRDYPGGKWVAEYIDISTNYLIDQDIVHAPANKDKLEAHRFKNVERQFLFVQYNKEFVQEIMLPSNSEVRLVKTVDIGMDDLGPSVKAFYKKFRDSATAYWSKGPNKLIAEGREKNAKNISEDGIKWKMKIWFAINLVCNYLFNFAYVFDLTDKYFPVTGDLAEFDFKNKDAIELAKAFFRKLTFPNNRQFDFSGFIDYVIWVIDNESELISISEDNECYFFVPPAAALEIWKLHDKYLSVFPDKDHVRGFLELSWRDISSGEKAFLDVFSRLYAAISSIPDAVKKNQPLYILLDEAEAGFHPKWQQAYVDYLIKFFEKQHGVDFILIISTHSPFIVSDLPAENLILLDKNDDGSCVVRDCLNSVRKTFGANIHSLLADSFFMEKGLMGIFAKNKIDAVIKWLRTEDREGREIIKQIIALVDEPLLEIKLAEMYAEKFGLDNEEERIRQQIGQLNQRLEDITKNRRQ